MLTIRDPQLAALRAAREPAFLDDLVAHLRAYHPDAVEDLSDDEIRARARVGVRRAGRYGFDKGRTAAAFVALMFEIAPNFDEHPAIRRCLTDEAIPVDARILDLVHRTTAAAWEEAEEAYDDAAWGDEPEERA
ncbi:MAG: hypothetical protein QM820_44960 [Minicystis sp.]